MTVFKRFKSSVETNGLLAESHRESREAEKYWDTD